MVKVLALALAACSTPAVAPPTQAVATRWPPIVDSHVHLSYDPVGAELANRGVLAAVDLAASEATLGQPSPIALIAAGPMLTHGGGYPLDEWGAAGFGIGCDDAPCVTATIDRLAHEGARVIKRSRSMTTASRPRSYLPRSPPPTHAA